MSGSSSRLRSTAAVLGLVLGSTPTTSLAGAADVVQARASCRGGSCDFRVSVRHEDEGWDHYADRFEVLDSEGRVLGTRVLRHPHVAEQPFTRGLSGVEIPRGTSTVRIRAHDSVHGYGGEERVVELPGTDSGE